MISLPQSDRAYELSRLSLYRIGLAGTYAKYRLVPRSAIVGYDELRQTVRAYRGGEGVDDLIAGLWQRHGAPSPTVIEAFLGAAVELECRGANAALPEFDAILAHPCRLGGLGRAAVRDLDGARLRLLEAWLGVCVPRSAVGRMRDNAELAVCFVLRRVRQYAHAVWAALGCRGATVVDGR